MATPWTPALAVGIPEIDQQHQELFLRVERLLRAIVAGDRAEIGRILEFLGDYVVKHFGIEERWMSESGYPDAAFHKAEHDSFIQDYLRFTVEFEQKGPTALVGMRLNNWIDEWLRRHIADSDQALGRFLKSKIA